MTLSCGGVSLQFGLQYYCIIVPWTFGVALEPSVSQLVFPDSQNSFACFHLAFGDTMVLWPTLPTKVHQGPGELARCPVRHPKPCNLCRVCQFAKSALASFGQVVMSESGRERHFYL